MKAMERNQVKPVRLQTKAGALANVFPTGGGKVKTNTGMTKNLQVGTGSGRPVANKAPGGRRA